MEKAYLEANQRELEMTKHISLMQFDPGALLVLRETGSCEIHIPEVFFDMDFPGQYFRRIKAVRVTIPCVAGPYTNVSATLRLTESWIRSTADVATDPEPVMGLPQTAIATSSANQDSGAFELNFNDPRYLPFEGAGVVSSWRLELPTALRSFDYDTIVDVIIHLSYTAREAQDGGTFKDAVNEQLVSSLNDLRKVISGQKITLARLISLRREFAADWNRFLLTPTGEAQRITLKLGKQHFPRYLDYLWEKNEDGNLDPQPITLEITSVKVYLDPKGVMPSDTGDIQINEKTPESVSDIHGLLFFDFSDLLTLEVSSESGADLSLSVSGDPLLPEYWKDLYVLMDYKIKS
jgi:Tc toxin complex TcA C-terminal TcB-binding domain